MLVANEWAPVVHFPNTRCFRTNAVLAASLFITDGNSSPRVDGSSAVVGIPSFVLFD